MKQWLSPLILLIALTACNDNAQKTDNSEASPVEPTSETSQSVTSLEGTNSPDTDNRHSDMPLDGINNPNTNNRHSVVPLDGIKKQYAGIALSILDASLQNYQDQPALSLSLSVPLNPALNHQASFQVMNDDEQLVDGAWQLSDNGRQLYFTAIEAETNYHISVLAGLTAATEVNLIKTFKTELKTKAAQAGVSFTTQKTVLVANEAKGLAISAINIENVDIDFFHIDLKQYPQYENSWYERSQSKDRWELERALKYSTPVYSGRFELNLPKNSRKNLYIDIASIEALQPAGFYLAVMKAASTYPYNFSTATFIVSDLGLHVRQYDQGMHVYTSSLKTGKALGLVDIQVMDNKGNTLVTQQSDADGIAKFQSLPKDSQYIIGKQQQQIAVINLQDAALDLSEFTLAKDLAASQSLFIYSARDLYRPGETVDLFALLRNLDGSMTKPQALKARLLQPDGQELKSFQWQPQTLSSYQYQLQLSKKAKTGLWNLEVEQADEFTQHYYFHVEDFLPERMNLLFADNKSANQNDTKQTIFHVDPINLKVSGEYLYGAPASGNILESFITPKIITEPFKSLPEFKFGNVKDNDTLYMQYLDDRQLDKEGKTTITADNLARGSESPVRLRISASLLESGGRPVTRHHDILSLPSNRLIGIRPVYNSGLDHFEANTLATFEVIRVDEKAQQLEAKGLQVKLIHERRDYHWVNRGAGWSYEFNEKHYTAFETTLDITADQQRTELKLPIEWGQYRLEITDPETKFTASTRITAGSNWWGEQDQAAQGTRPDQIKLSWDKPSYKAGDTALLTLLPPYAGEGFVVVESDRPLWGQRISLPPEGSTISIPVTSEWKRPDIYATAVIFRPSSQVDLITPKRALGLLHLPLDYSQQLLEIQIQSPDKIEPNKTLKIQLQAKNIQNQQIRVQVMAVDVGVLNITSFESPNPHQWLFEPRRLRVESHDMYGDIVEYLKADLARQKFGGDADLAQGGEQAKADVQIISILHPLVDFDEDGKAQIEFDIPDFNGRLRIMAVAFGDNQFGAVDKEINVAAPIIAEIAMPRFIALNDQAHVTLELQNLTNKQQKISTDLNSTNPLKISTSRKHQLTLQPNERKLLHYQVTATAYGKGQFTLELNNADNSIQLQRQWTLSSRSPYPAESYKSNKVIEKGETLSLETKVTENLIASGTAASLSVSDQAPIDITAHVSSLLQYPYGCLEQTSSRIYPLLFADKKAIKRWQLDDKDWTQQKRFQQIDNGLTHISGMQLYNGGFGLWDNDSEEEFWLTAYVSHMLLDAEQQGIDIPKNQQKKALKRLGKYMKTPLALMGDSRSSNKKAYRFAYKAYAAYVLSRLNKAPIAQLRKLYDRNKKRNESILPMLHMAIALQQQGDHKRAKEALQKVTQIKRSNSYLADYGSTVRDLAMASYLMLQHQLSVPGQNWLFELSDNLRDRKWLSTQERNALFLLGNALENKQHKKWFVDLTMGDDNQSIQAEGKKSWHWKWQQLQQQISLINKNDFSLYSSLRITGYPQNAPEDMQNDLSIERRYYNKLGEEIELDLIRQGELVIVSLSVESDNKHPDTLIVDMLPAGFEIENQNLGNSVSLESIRINEKSIASLEKGSNIVHRESLDDRFIAAVKIGKYQSANVFYLMRAVTPGLYQVPAAFAEDMYRPEFRSIFNGKHTQVTIHAR